MASVFTFDPDPPRVSSPWSAPSSATPRQSNDGSILHCPEGFYEGWQSPPAVTVADGGLRQLEAEPQEGPTEYKLHLLLRSRRSFTAQNSRFPGLPQPRSTHRAPRDADVTGSPRKENTSTPTPSTTQSRQLRLQQLTTQLLWRLQQSSPYHTSTTNDLILPTLPEGSLSAGGSTRPVRLHPGLEESQGALYEIGVADDGTFVGLTNDEMEESLCNLRMMAASLGCDVQILRTMILREYQLEPPPPSPSNARRPPTGERLWVAEALVKPHLRAANRDRKHSEGIRRTQRATGEEQTYGNASPQLSRRELPSVTEQLRVSLTGGSTSGKSSLLGTLSTGTLDNGRGKSRLSLLKHRHEIVSGVTSSVAQELIGYQTSNDPGVAAHAVNFASGNVSSWIDIHSACGNGRLVFFSDSAGHPRYRRTTVRGLVGWAPHWTILCVAADENTGQGERETGSQEPTPSTSPGSPHADVNTSDAHLELCLRLNIPLIVVVTKLDLASKTGFRSTFTKILSALKLAGRRPALVSRGSQEEEVGNEAALQTITVEEQTSVLKATDLSPDSDPRDVVPIVFTSAVTGTGITSLHAVLRTLPTPSPPSPNAQPALRPGRAVSVGRFPATLYHVEEVFALPASAVTTNSHTPPNTYDITGAVLSGHLRYGTLSVGDDILLGPFPALDAEDAADAAEEDMQGLSGASRGSPPARPSGAGLRLFRSPLIAAVSHHQGGSDRHVDWRPFHVVSVRNLRLPVRRLSAGQVGTVGIVQKDPTGADPELQGRYTSSNEMADAPNIHEVRGLRKGFVLLASTSIHPPSAFSGFAASFTIDESTSISCGDLVIVYVASVRALARITRIHAVHPDMACSGVAHDVFEFDAGARSGLDDGLEARRDGSFDVSFTFTGPKEWIEVGSRVLVMPGGGGRGFRGQSPPLAGPATARRGNAVTQGQSGLEGIVGDVTEVLE